MFSWGSFEGDPLTPSIELETPHSVRGDKKGNGGDPSQSRLEWRSTKSSWAKAKDLFRFFFCGVGGGLCPPPLMVMSHEVRHLRRFFTV